MSIMDMNILDWEDHVRRNTQYPNQGGPATAIPFQSQYGQVGPQEPFDYMSLMSMNNPQDGIDQSLLEPTPPSSYRNMDVSGFANSGMQAPALPDPMGQIQGLMKMAIGSNIAGNQAQGQLPPRGGLMAYLMNLAGGQNG